MDKQYDIKEINYIKGLAILLVFIGHSATPSFLERPYIYELIVQLIYSFHMSVFFIVSGFLSYKVIDMNLKENYCNFIKSKFFRLIIPFLTISFLTNSMILILQYIFNEPLNISSIIDMIKTIFLYPENGVMGALWFLYTLFIISIISPIIVKLPMKIVLTLSLLLNLLIPQDKNFLSTSRISFFLIYFLIGLYFRKYFFENKNIEIRGIIALKKYIACIISLVGIIYYAYIITNQIQIPIYILRTLNFLCGLFGVILLIIIVENIQAFKICLISLSFLGKYSMDIYLLSWFFQVISMILISNILKINNYNIFFISNVAIGSLSIPFSIYILRRYTLLKLLILGENSKNNLTIESISSNNI